MRGRVLLLIGAIILLAVVVVVVFVVLPQNEEDPEREGGETAQIDSACEDVAAQTGGEASPVIHNIVNIVVAIQVLPRSLTIPDDRIALQPWPEGTLPEAENYFVDMNDVI